MKRYAACIIMMLASIAATAQNMGFGTNMGQPHHPATVITRVKAPEWIQPIRVADYSDPVVANLSAEVPMLQWLPVVAEGVAMAGITYDLCIVRLMPDQAPDQAIRRNPKVYEKKSLMVPQCLLPKQVMSAFEPEATYVAQVRAKLPPGGQNVQLIDGGRSALMLFKVAPAASSNQPNE